MTITFKAPQKFYYTIFVLTILFGLKSHAQLTPSFAGNTIDLGNNCYQITSNTNFQLGAVWYNNAIDLNSDFDIVFDANFGVNDANGADGIVFVLKTSPATVVGNPGGDLGYGGINNSMAVEFDTWQNNDRNDPFNDHVALISDGNTNHVGATALSPSVNASAVSGNIEDGVSHEIKITWRAMSQEFRVVFDCNERILYSDDIINNLFGGNSNVFFGFTGSTGGSTNLQTVCFKSISFVDEFLLDNQSICSGDIINSIDATYDDASNYLWSPSTGVSNITIPNPIFSPIVDTTYTVQITDACGEIVSTNFDVTVVPTGDSTFTMLPSCTGATVNSVTTPGGTYAFNPPPADGAIINVTSGNIANGVPGTNYTVNYTTSGTCPSTSQFTVTLGATSDPSFTVTGTCDGATATITGDTGGFFVFNPVPTDAAVIDASTGTITGGTPSATYTVEYTTVGSCSDTSTQNVTVLALEDATFTMSASCDGGTATITGDAGGTFVFNPVPTDGALIDAATGTITNGV
ncbi:MAG: hypothetical protein QNK89_09415, partial [Lacinutrix sp.]